MRWVRRLRTTALVVAGAILAIAIAGLPLYVFPGDDEVTTADVVYVIGPPTDVRLVEAEALLEQGVADAALISIPADDSRSSRMLDRECDKVRTICATPDPFTTIGEARMLTDHGAESAVVITFTPHVARTRFIFAKCFDGEIAVVGVDQNLSLWQWIHSYAYQTGAFVKALLEPCP